MRFWKVYRTGLSPKFYNFAEFVYLRSFAIFRNSFWNSYLRSSSARITRPRWGYQISLCHFLSFSKVLSNIKILTTALLFKWVMKVDLTIQKWTALFILFLGACLTAIGDYQSDLGDNKVRFLDFHTTRCAVAHKHTHTRAHVQTFSHASDYFPRTKLLLVLMKEILCCRGNLIPKFWGWAVGHGVWEGVWALSLRFKTFSNWVYDVSVSDVAIEDQRLPKKWTATTGFGNRENEVRAGKNWTYMYMYLYPIFFSRFALTSAECLFSGPVSL